MRWWTYTAIGMVGYLVFTVAKLPASYAINYLQNSNLPVSASETTGTIWSGEMQHSRYKQYDLGTVNWTFRPLALLLGQLTYRLEMINAKETLTGLASINISGDTKLHEVNGRIQASQIPHLINQPYLETSGSLDVDLQALQLRQKMLYSADGTVRWLGAAITSPIKSDFGSLLFTLSGSGGEITTKIQDVEGSIKVNGEIKLFPDGTYQIQGKVKPTDRSATDLATTLRTFGRPTADGSIQLNYSGQL